MRIEQAPDSVFSGEQKATDPSYELPTSPLRQRKTSEEHNAVCHQTPSPSSTPRYEATSNGMTSNSGASTRKCTRILSLLRKPCREFGIRAPAKRTARGRKRAPQCALSCQAYSNSPPQYIEDGHSSSAFQGAGTVKTQRPLLSTGAVV